jgi:hypothetical protein
MAKIGVAASSGHRNDKLMTNEGQPLLWYFARSDAKQPVIPTQASRLEGVSGTV